MRFWAHRELPFAPPGWGWLPAVLVLLVVLVLVLILLIVLVLILVVLVLVVLILVPVLVALVLILILVVLVLHGNYLPFVLDAVKTAFCGPSQKGRQKPAFNGCHFAACRIGSLPQKSGFILGLEN